MDSAAGGGERWRSEKRMHKPPSTIQSLDHGIMCLIFASLDLFDLVRCSSVCKSWNLIINRSKLLYSLYKKQEGSDDPSSLSTHSERSLNIYLEELAMHHHRFSLHEGSVFVEQWKGHAIGVDKCRMRMGLVLTGVGDKVMRLWSSESYKCLEEYSLSDMSPLVDFDFDESKIVGLVGTRICIWRLSGNRSLFPSREGTFPKGICMRYVDPEAVVGCEDGTARVFDMYSKKCSQIIRMQSGPVTCLYLGEDHRIMSGSSLGSISVSDLSSDLQVVTLKSADRAGIKTLCYNPSSHLLFAGSTYGCASCWDLRTMRMLWENRVSPNVIYTMQNLQHDTSTLVVGGIDGVLRILDQNTGDVLSRCVMQGGHGVPTSSSKSSYGAVETKRVERLLEDASIDSIPWTDRPPIKCLAVGMKKVITTHNGKYIRLWKFNKSME
ncbi:hypothetical protein Nepgr_006243 [Nepenthes gracilis]|uniref:F-box domain-containing protein n=1 Tax=Nepenthes gracilis TaxID=150966 RepID=A0AAD3S522_NEPGR|nr:hypothetical protein Nepgr_006243 [Nepenthes gracilis]